jgi:hypothetical protein
VRQAAYVGAIALGLWSIATAVEPSKDYDPAQTRCMSGNEKTIERLLADLDAADQAFPNVPPEEEQFLAAESAHAQRLYQQESERKNEGHAESSKVYEALARRPLYYVWKMRKDLLECVFQRSRTAVSV